MASNATIASTEAIQRVEILPEDVALKRRLAPWSSVCPASSQPMVPLRSAATGLGMPASR